MIKLILLLNLNMDTVKACYHFITMIKFMKLRKYPVINRFIVFDLVQNKLFTTLYWYMERL